MVFPVGSHTRTASWFKPIWPNSPRFSYIFLILIFLDIVSFARHKFDRNHLTANAFILNLNSSFYSFSTYFFFKLFVLIMMQFIFVIFATLFFIMLFSPRKEIVYLILSLLLVYTLFLFNISFLLLSYIILFPSVAVLGSQFNFVKYNI